MRLLAIVLFSSLLSTSAIAEPLVALESKFAVKETIDRLAATLERRGISVIARVDHAAGAKAAGMNLPPTEVLIFGNPKLGTPLMQSNPLIGIDLPMKILSWQDKTGKVWIGYVAPATLKSRYGIGDRDEVFQSMTKALEGLTKAARGDE
jgi:uncharacterized protein (DUF302 family)